MQFTIASHSGDTILVNCVSRQAESGGIDWLAIIAVAISIATLFVTIALTIISKRIELNNAKFQKHCIDIIEGKLNDIGLLFNTTNPLNSQLPLITDRYMDLYLFLNDLKVIYPKIDVNEFQNLCNEFTDVLYRNSNENTENYKGKFLINKIRIIDFLYEHAIYKELNMLSKKLYKLSN